MSHIVNAIINKSQKMKEHFYIEFWDNYPEVFNEEEDPYEKIEIGAIAPHLILRGIPFN